MKSRRSKLVVASGFLALMVVVVAVTLVGFFRFATLHKQLTELTDSHHRKTQLLSTMRIAVRERAISLVLMANISDPFEQDQEMLHFNQLGTEFADARTALLAESMPQAERDLVEHQSKLTVEVRPLHSHLIDLALGGNFVAAHRFLAQRVIPAQNEIVNTVREIQKLEDEEYQRQFRKMSVNYRNGYFIFVALLALSAVGFGLITMLLVARRIDATELQLLNEQERYALAVRGANDGLWDWDLNSNKNYYSPRWKDMLGFDDHEISDSPDEWVKRIHADDAEKTLATLTAHLNGLSYYFESEHRLQHKDGRYRWFLMRGLALRDEKGRAYRIAGSITDINDRKRYEKHLHQNESRMRMVLDHVVDGIITTNDRGTVESMNSAAEEMFGVKSQDIVGRPFTRLLSDPFRQEYDRHFADYADQGSSGIVGTSVQLRGTRKSGLTFALSCTFTEMQMGAERKLIVIARDVSKHADQKQLSA